MMEHDGERAFPKTNQPQPEQHTPTKPPNKTKSTIESSLIEKIDSDNAPMTREEKDD